MAIPVPKKDHSFQDYDCIAKMTLNVSVQHPSFDGAFMAPAVSDV